MGHWNQPWFFKNTVEQGPQWNFWFACSSFCFRLRKHLNDICGWSVSRLGPISVEENYNITKYFFFFFFKTGHLCCPGWPELLSSEPPASASRVPRIPGNFHHAGALICFTILVIYSTDYKERFQLCQVFTHSVWEDNGNPSGPRGSVMALCSAWPFPSLPSYRNPLLLSTFAENCSVSICMLIISTSMPAWDGSIQSLPGVGFLHLLIWKTFLLISLFSCVFTHSDLFSGIIFIFVAKSWSDQ